jgi:hypothetical protein
MVVFCCPVCYYRYHLDNAKVYTCGHVVCTYCTDRLKELQPCYGPLETLFHCPICRTLCGFDSNIYIDLKTCQHDTVCGEESEEYCYLTLFFTEVAVKYSTGDEFTRWVLAVVFGLLVGFLAAHSSGGVC